MPPQPRFPSLCVSPARGEQGAHSTGGGGHTRCARCALTLSLCTASRPHSLWAPRRMTLCYARPASLSPDSSAASQRPAGVCSSSFPANLLAPPQLPVVLSSARGTLQRGLLGNPSTRGYRRSALGGDRRHFRPAGGCGHHAAHAPPQLPPSVHFVSFSARPPLPSSLFFPVCLASSCRLARSTSLPSSPCPARPSETCCRRRTTKLTPLSAVRPVCGRRGYGVSKEPTHTVRLFLLPGSSAR